MGSTDEVINTACDAERGMGSTDEDILKSLKVPVEPNELTRLACLRRSRLLDSDTNDPEYDRYTDLAKRVFKVNIALISLVDIDRQWFKSKVGLDACETHRNEAFCAYVVLRDAPDVLVVNDALEDERFKSNSLVTGPPYIRFYAGSVISYLGEKIGTLCIIDQEPRQSFTIDEQAILLDMANALSANIKSRIECVRDRQVEKSKMVLDMMHNLRTPLTSISLACKNLRTVSETKSTDNSSDNWQWVDESLSDLSSGISTLSLMIETSLSMGAMSIEKDGIIHQLGESTLRKDKSKFSVETSVAGKESTYQGVTCNIPDIVNKAIDIIQSVEYDKISIIVDHESFGEYTEHIGYPNTVLFVLLSSASNAFLANSCISIFITYQFSTNDPQQISTLGDIDSAKSEGFLSIEFSADGKYQTGIMEESIFPVSSEEVKHSVEDLGGSVRRRKAQNGTNELLEVVVVSIPCISVKYDLETDISRTEYSKEKNSSNLPLRILLVEDTLLIQKLICRQLEKLNCHVTTADNGKQALESIKVNEPFDVIIFDFLMPVMTGPEMMEQLHEQFLLNSPTLKTIVIGISATACHQDQVRLGELGMHKFYSKPLDPNALETLIYLLKTDMTIEQVIEQLRCSTSKS